MKTRSQKLISLVLVLMMLVTLVPMGMISANAEASAELTAALAANAKELTINSVEDWKAVSAATASYTATTGASFSGVTIKLGADIDAQGGALPALCDASGSFYGVFDGQGHTVKNVVMAQAAGNIGLIAASLGGGKVTNVNFDNVTLSTTAGHIGLIAGHNSIWADLELSKIKATKISVTNTGTDGHTGGLIGNHQSNWSEDVGFALTATQINFQGTVTHTNTAGNAVGGLFGNATVKVNSTFEKISVEADVTFASSTAPTAIMGGFIGNLTMSNKTQYPTITDIYVGGSLTSASASQIGAFVGKFCGNAGATVADVSDIVIAVNMAAAHGNTVTFCGVHGGNLVYKNIYSINKANGGVYQYGLNRWTGMSYNGDSYYNGVANPWTNADPICDTLTYVVVSIAKKQAVKDANGFISEIIPDTEVVINPLEEALVNYANTTEFVIKSAEDWNLIAESGKTWDNRTIKLGADISNATLKPLSAQFVGTFDGAGYTMTNIVVEGGALIASGRIHAKAVVRNLKIDGLKVNGTGGLAAWFEMGGNLLFENIDIANLDVQSTGTAGGLVGFGVTKGDVSVQFNNINLSGSVKTTAQANAGALIGYMIERADGLAFNNVYTDVDVTVETTNMGNGAADGLGAIAAGGFIGMVKSDGSTPADAYPLITFKNCVSAGTVSTPSAACAFIGYGNGRVTLNFTNVIDAATKNVTEGAVWKFAGTFVAARGGIRVNYSNATVVEETAPWKAAAVGNSYGYAENISGLTIQGANPAAGYGPVQTNHYDDIQIVPAATAERMIAVDANGFIKMIDDHVHAFAYQTGTSSNGAAIRFIAKSHLTKGEVAKVTMTVVATTASGVVKEFTADCELYDKITAYGEYGVSNVYEAAEFNAGKLAALTIYGLPAEDITFEITTTYTTANGYTVTGTNTMTVAYTAQ